MGISMFVQQLEANHNRVINYLGMSHDVNLTTSLAAKYTLAGAQYSGVAFDQFKEQMQRVAKQQYGTDLIRTFSSVSTSSYQLIAYLFLHNNRDQLIENMIKNDRRLHEVGFKKCIYRYIAALNLSENVSHETIAHQLYAEMRKKHRFLTGKDDIPYAVLMTMDMNKEVVTRATSMYRYYEDLQAANFKIGNALQALSQILSTYNVTYNDQLVPYVTQLKIELEKRQIKVKKMHYAQLGVLALTLANTEIVNRIAEVYTHLTATKMLKNHKEIALRIAIQYTVKQLVEVQQTITMGQVHNVLEILNISDLTMDVSLLLFEGVTSLFSGDILS